MSASAAAGAGRLAFEPSIPLDEAIVVGDAWPERQERQRSIPLDRAGYASTALRIRSVRGSASESQPTGTSHTPRGRRFRSRETSWRRRDGPPPEKHRARPAQSHHFYCPPHPSPPECRPSVPRAWDASRRQRRSDSPVPRLSIGSAAGRTPGAGRSVQGTALPRPPRGSTRTRVRRRGRAGRLRGPGTRCGRRRSSRTASRPPRPAACTCASRGVNDLPGGAAARVRVG